MKKLLKRISGTLFSYSLMLIVFMGVWITLFDIITSSFNKEAYPIIHNALVELHIDGGFFLDNWEHLLYSFVLSFPVWYVAMSIAMLIFGIVYEIVFGREPLRTNLHVPLILFFIWYIYYSSTKLLGGLGDGYSPLNILLAMTLVISIWRVFDILKYLWKWQESRQ